MKKHFLWIAFIFSIEAFSDTVEEKLMTGIDLEASHSFLHNPAILDISKKSYSILAVKDTRNSSVLASPDGGTPQNVSYTLNENIVAGSMLVPFGGGAFGLSYIRPVSYTHLRAHETSLHLVCRLLLEKTPPLARLLE